MVIIFHPSNITYDYSTAKTWGQYRKRNKRNKRVKEFRKLIWMKETWNILEWGGLVSLNWETYLGNVGWYDIYVK